MVDEVENLKSLVQNYGGCEEDVKHSTQCEWIIWSEASGVLCDERIPMSLKSKFFKSVVRPTELYGSDFKVLSD